MAGLIPFHTFDTWHFDASSGLHDHTNDILKLFLSFQTPDEATHQKALDPILGLGEINTGFGYDGAIDIQQAADLTGPIYTLFAEPIFIFATGGTIGPFRYLALFNETLVIGGFGRLISYWDQGLEISILDGGSHEIFWQGVGPSPPAPGPGGVLSIF